MSDAHIHLPNWRSTPALAPSIAYLRYWLCSNLIVIDRTVLFVVHLGDDGTEKCQRATREH